MSDNGRHYSSFAFLKFAEAWGFDHVTSSPHSPQSNCFIEGQIQSVKATVKKAAMTKSDLQMALLASAQSYTCRQPSTISRRNVERSQVQDKCAGEDKKRELAEGRYWPVSD